MNEELSRKRRRLRRRATASPGISSACKRTIPLCPDVSFDLMHSDKQSPPRNIPILLHLLRRELGIGSRGSMMRWNERMLHDEEGKGWRRFARRTLTFRQLQTPAEDAILGIDHTGSYAVALGGHSEREDLPVCFQDHGLFVRLYGLPSKARTNLFSHNLKGAPVSPLLHTIPISYVVDDMWLYEMGLPAVLPTCMMFHRDEMIGAAKVGSLKSVPSNHPYARIDDVITLFPLLRRRNRSSVVVRTLNLGKRCNSVDMYLFSSYFLPHRSSSHESLHSIPCKILIIHYGSIMRFCWILVNNEFAGSKLKSYISNGVSQGSNAENSFLREPIHLDIGKIRQTNAADVQWETKVYNLVSSDILPNHIGTNLDGCDYVPAGASEPIVEDEKDLQVLLELQFDVFFVCLEVRRLIQYEMGLHPECRKENTRNLFVCTHDNCRAVELFVSFLVSQNDCHDRLGAFVMIDLGTNQFEVTKWIFKRHHEEEDKWLSSVRSLRLHDIREHGCALWSFLQRIDIKTNSKNSFWNLKNEFVETGSTLQLQPPELDQVDVVDNFDVLRHIPVDTFWHPMTPTRIVYSENSTS